jgi:hypothetical protein
MNHGELFQSAKVAATTIISAHPCLQNRRSFIVCLEGQTLFFAKRKRSSCEGFRFSERQSGFKVIPY